MELFRNQDGVLFFSNDYTYENDFNGYIHNDDVSEYYMDDDMSDIEVVEFVDADRVETYVEWCKQESLDPKDARNLSKFLELCNS